MSVQPPLNLADPEPRPNLGNIQFPSDQLSIKTLRSLFPDVFDAHVAHLREFESIELSALLGLERDLATASFDKVLNRRTVVITGEETQMLSDLYVQYRLASGRHHAQQLIRAFEQAAAAQARERLRNPPSR